MSLATYRVRRIARHAAALAGHVTPLVDKKAEM